MSLEFNLQKGLVGHWTMDNTDTSGGTLYDRSAYNNHGRLKNTPTINISSPLGEAYDFEYTNNEWVDVNNGVQQELDGGESASISMLVRCVSNDPGNGDQTGLLSMDGSGSSNNHYPWTNSNLYLSVFRANRLGPLTNNFDKTKWHRLTITTEPGTDGYKVYQDNNLNIVRGGESTVSVEKDVAFGYNVSGNHYFDGDIADVRVYDRVLSESEISALYNMRSQRTANI